MADTVYTLDDLLNSNILENIDINDLEGLLNKLERSRKKLERLERSIKSLRRK